MSLFGANIQQQTQTGLFSGSSNSIFGSSNNNPNTNNKGLFGNILTNTGSQNTNNQQTNDKQTPSLFSNNPIGTNGLFGFNNNNNQTTTNNNNTNDKGLFSGINPLNVPPSTIINPEGPSSSVKYPCKTPGLTCPSEVP